VKKPVRLRKKHPYPFFVNTNIKVYTQNITNILFVNIQPLHTITVKPLLKRRKLPFNFLCTSIHIFQNAFIECINFIFKHCISADLNLQSREHERSLIVNIGLKVMSGQAWLIMHEG